MSLQNSVCAKEKATNIFCDWTARINYQKENERAQKRGQIQLTTGWAENSMETKVNLDES